MHYDRALSEQGVSDTSPSATLDVVHGAPPIPTANTHYTACHSGANRKPSLSLAPDYETPPEPSGRTDLAGVQRREVYLPADEPENSYRLLHPRTLGDERAFFSNWDATWAEFERAVVFSSRGPSVMSVEWGQLERLWSSFSWTFFCLCLGRTVSLIALQYIVACVAPGQDMKLFSETTIKPFAKPGLLTVLQCFAGGIPFLIDLAKSQASRSLWHDRLARFIQYIVDPACARFGIDTGQLIPRHTPTRTSLAPEDPPEALNALLSAEGVMFLLPALCESVATWLLMLGLVALPWPFWAAAAFWSLAVEVLLPGARQQHNPARRTAVAFIWLGCSLIWVVSATFVSVTVPQVILPVSRGDTTSTTSVDATAHTLVPRSPSLPASRLAFYTYGTGYRAIFVLTGQALRVVGVALQDLLQISSHIEVASAGKVHGAEAFLVSVLLVPLASSLLPGGDYHGAFESLRDTLSMIHSNQSILVGCFVFLASLTGCHIIARRLMGRISVLQLAGCAALELSVSTAVAWARGIICWPGTSIRCPAVAWIFGIGGCAACTVGLLISAGIVVTADTADDAGAYIDCERYYIVETPTAIVSLHGGPLAPATTSGLAGEEDAAPAKWSSFHPTWTQYPKFSDDQLRSLYPNVMFLDTDRVP